MLLTPEAYLPLRAVSTHYHASMEGAAAARRACDILETAPARAPAAARGTGPEPDLRRDEIVLDQLTLTYPGRDLTAYRAGDVRTVIGGCPQDPHIFATTIRENLAVARPGASGAELAEAAGKARLLPWIESLPHGWDTQAGSRGGAVSGGERQRLALARALLAAPELMILDELAAHLDPDTRAAVTADLLTATAGRATLLITHELRGLEQVDEIVVLDRDRVAGRGTHATLLRECPLYRRMHEAERALTTPGPGDQPTRGEGGGAARTARR